MRVGALLSGLISAALLVANPSPAAGQQYSLSFNKSSTRMTWGHRLPSWSYAVPVRLSASGDSAAMLRVSTSASMRFILDERQERKTWQDNASVSASVNYPILGPKASIGIGANMSTRNATLQQQKIRNQSFNYRFQYSPLQEGRFKSLRVNVTPGLITASRASRANLDSTIEEQGIQYSASLRVSPDVKLAGRKLSNSISMGKRDNTLKNNKNRSENLNMSLGYTLPKDVRTNISMSESRSQVGVTVRLDTAVTAALSESRNTSLSSSMDFKLGRFDLKNRASYRENLRTNTTSASLYADNRYLGTDRESRDWKLETSASGKLTERLVGRFSVRYNSGEEGFLPIEAEIDDLQKLPDRLVREEDGRWRDPSSDLSTQDFFVNGSLDWQLAEQHSLKLAAWVEIKQAENPGAPEQDRDTYSNNASLSYDGTLASGIRLNIALKNGFHHRVNLHATRSSDNSRNRDIGLDVNTRYERLGISFSHKFGISAKRTIYDFDRQLTPGTGERTGRSNIRRGWSMVHSLRRRFFEHLQLNTRYSYRADDFGELTVESQKQVVREDNSDHNVSFGMSYSPSSTLTTSVNYTYRLDRQWEHQYANYQEERIRNRRNRHQNLGLSVSYNPSSVTRLTMRGSRSRQRSGTFDSFNVSYSRTI